MFYHRTPPPAHDNDFLCLICKLNHVSDQIPSLRLAWCLDQTCLFLSKGQRPHQVFLRDNQVGI